MFCLKTALSLVLLLASFGAGAAAAAAATAHHDDAFPLHARQASNSVTTFYPVPSTAVAPVVPAAGYIQYALGGGAYAVTDGVYIAMFMVTTRGVIVFDAPATIGDNLRYAIGNTTSNPVTHLVYSHHHGDHICAARQFPKYYRNVEVVAHKNALQALRTIGNDSCARPLPTRTFERELRLQVDNQTLELSWKGENHSPDNIFIWAPAQRVLMLVDIVFPRWVPFYSLAVSSSIPGYVRAHDQALAYPFDVFIGGHLAYTGTRADVQLQRDYVADLYDDCYAAIVESGNASDRAIGVATTLPPVEQANPGNSWAVFREYFYATSQSCGARVVEKYRGKLAGVDVWLVENALAMIVSIRLDYGQLGPFGYAAN